MIRYYLGEEPILKNVPTYELDIPENQSMVFSNMNKMVIKKTNESGGYGMLMGNTATEKEIEDFQKQSADFDKWMLKVLIITIMLSLVFVSYLIVNL